MPSQSLRDIRQGLRWGGRDLGNVLTYLIPSLPTEVSPVKATSVVEQEIVSQPSVPQPEVPSWQLNQWQLSREEFESLVSSIQTLSQSVSALGNSLSSVQEKVSDLENVSRGENETIHQSIIMLKEQVNRISWKNDIREVYNYINAIHQEFHLALDSTARSIPVPFFSTRRKRVWLEASLSGMGLGTLLYFVYQVVQWITKWL